MNMEKYMKQVTSHTTSQQISDFIFTGDDYIRLDERNYTQRLEQHSQPIIDRLKSIYGDEEELDQAICELNEALNEQERVSREIGLKTGVRLMLNLLSC